MQVDLYNGCKAMVVIVVSQRQTYPCSLLCVQSNLLQWIALRAHLEHPLRQSIHLSMFYNLHCVLMGPER